MRRATVSLAVLLALAAPSAARAEWKSEWDQKLKNMPAGQLRRYAPGAPMLRNVPDGVVVTSRITRIEAYPSGALIERAARVELEAGDRRLVFPALPDALNASTLNVTGFGGDAVAGSTFIEAGTLVEARPADLVELEDALRALDAQDRALASEEDAFRQRRELLVANVSKMSSASALAVEALDRALDFAQKEMVRIDAELVRIGVARGDLTPRLAAVRKDHDDLRARLERPVKHVVLEVAARRKVALDLVVRYFVAGPGWTPRHVCRFDPASGGMTLETYAWLVQETGETWKDVSLRVSSARPTGGLNPPEPGALDVTAEKGDGGRVATETRGLREVASTGYATGGQRAFEVPGTVTLESGPRGRRVLLETLQVPVEARRVAVPRVTPGVYLRLTLRNPSTSPLFAGEAALFNGADYVGSATLPVVRPDETLVLPFGRDPAVDVTRVRTGRETEASGRATAVTYRYAYEATSRLARAVEVEVREQVPTSKDRTVKVATLDGTPAPVPAGKDFAAGTVTWRIEVPAGGRVAWKHGYTLTAPAGQRILGAD